MSILSLKENPKFIDSSDALAVALCHYFSGGAGIQNGFKKAPKSKNSWGKFVEQNPDKVLARK